jgi:hypothetical protein
VEQTEHVVLLDCNFSDNSLVDNQSNVLTALELRTVILQARSDKDFRRSLNTLTPTRRYLGRSLVHKEEILLAWASKQNDDNLVDNVTFFIFNEVCQMREALGAIMKKNQNILELQKKISEMSKEKVKLWECSKSKNLKFSNMETGLKAAKRDLFSGE